MVLLLLFITIAACVAFDYVMRRRRGELTSLDGAEGAAPAQVESPAGDKGAVWAMPTSENLYYHPGHTWLAVESDGSARVGVDKLGRRLIGSESTLEPPSVGQSIRQGMPIWTVDRRGRTAAMLSPVDGVVEEINPRMVSGSREADDGSVASDWVVRVRAAELDRNTRNLLQGGMVEAWAEESLMRLRGRFDRDLGPVLNDGGAIRDDLGMLLDDDEWASVCRELFLTESA